MDSLRTDGMSAKSHLLWMQEDISDNVRTWETSDMFFHTKHYLLWHCSSWLFQHVDDYKWATSKRRLLLMWLWRIDMHLLECTFFLFKRWFHHLATFPFTAVLGKKVKGPDDYQEVKDRLVADYQTYLDGRWVDRLRSSAKVEINQEVLKTVNNHWCNRLKQYLRTLKTVNISW